MSKLTVESIINIYGSRVKEIKAYNEARRAKVEDFLQTEPVAFALSDEPDVLRIYIDKESAAASLDGTLKEDTAKFEAGKTYYSRSICDHECIFTIGVVKRTEKSVTYIYEGKQRRSMVKTDENGEYIKPDRYSMAPTFRAERLYEGLKKYRVKAGCLVDEGWVTWEIEAESEENAWGIGYGLALKSNVADSGNVEVEEITEGHELTVKGLPKYREVKSIDFENVWEKCIEKRWYTRGTTEEYTALANYIFDLEEVTTENLVAIASDILEHSETDYNIEAILWELNRVCNTYFVHE